MLDSFVIAAVLYLPVFAVCGLFYFVGTVLTRPGLGTWVCRSAIAWCAVLCLLFGLILVAMGTCQGDMLYGYRGCTIFSITFANLSLPAFLLAVLAAVIYGAALALVAAVLEWRYRRR